MVKTLQNVIQGTVISTIAAEGINAGVPVKGTTTAATNAAADDHILGIAMQTVETDDDLSVLASGQCDVVAGGIITAGDYVKVGTTGKFLSADATAFAAGKVVGKAISSAAADGDSVTILVGTL